MRKPEIDAQLIADSITQQLEKRIMFRRAMKRAMQNAMRLGAQGIKIMSAGRLNGIEIARTEWYREGRVPLHTLRADIDYGFSRSQDHLRRHRRQGLGLQGRHARPQWRCAGRRHAAAPKKSAARVVRAVTAPGGDRPARPPWPGAAAGAPRPRRGGNAAPADGSDKPAEATGGARCSRKPAVKRVRKAPRAAADANG